MSDAGAGDVDENGRPEGPVQRAVEKRKQKQLAIAGIGVGVAGLIYMTVKGRRSPSSTATTSSAGYTYPTMAGAPSYLSGASGGTVDLSSLTSTLTSMQQELQTLSEQGMASSTGSTTGGGQVGSLTPSQYNAQFSTGVSGAGYGGESFQTSSGNYFDAFANQADAAAYVAGGGQEWYQPSPGVAAKWNPATNGNVGGTPTWLYAPGGPVPAGTTQQSGIPAGSTQAVS